MAATRSVMPAWRPLRSRDRARPSQHVDDQAVELGSVQRHGADFRTDEVRAPGFEKVAVRANVFTKSAPESVANDGVPNVSADRVGNCRWARGVAPEHADREGARAMTTGADKGTEGLTAADASDQAESLARPWRRRPLITARPARVRIRRRKPCFFLRFRILG